MRRDLQAMQGPVFDVAIIGGGITGVCIARDAALRGLSVAIVDKGDWCSATSAGSTKILHGGARYLRRLELGLIREGLRERRIWQRIAPHMVAPLPFLVPTWGGLANRMILDAGLTLYDLLSYDKGRLSDPDQRIPGHSRLTRSEAITMEPVLDSPSLTGALLYYDCHMHSPERLGLACLVDATELGAVAANYAEVTGIAVGRNRGREVTVRDVFTQERVTLRARVVVNATGPWADAVQALAQPGRKSIHLRRSKGIHLIVRALTRRHALTVLPAGGHFFVIPWRGHSLIGATDTVFNGAPDDVAVTEDEVTSFIAFVNHGIPEANLRRDDVLHSYAALRPLVDDGSASSYHMSRRAEIVDHTAEGSPGLISAIGGKWTTSRAIAGKTVNLVQRFLRQSQRTAETDTRPLPGGATGPFAAFRQGVSRAHPGVPTPILEHLLSNYGDRVGRVLALSATDATLGVTIAPNVSDIGAQVVYAVREEMALTLSDVIFRRTGMGTLGYPGAPVIQTAAQLMARELHWTPAETARQVAAVEARYSPPQG